MVLNRFEISGLDWIVLIRIFERVLELDNFYRKHGMTLFRNRDWVETAFNELKNAGERAKLWIHYVETERWYGKEVIRFISKDKEFKSRLLGVNERHLVSAPKRVRLKVTPDVITGIAVACCKAKGLDEVFKEKEESFLSDIELKVAEWFWNRSLLYSRRSVAAQKAAYRRKGVILVCEQAPDYRDPEFHEGAKLLYDLEEVEKNGNKGD